MDPETKFVHSDMPVRKVKFLQFGILNPDDFKKYSVMQQENINGIQYEAGVTKSSSYENGQATYGGINDPRMGNTDDRSEYVFSCLFVSLYIVLFFSRAHVSSFQCLACRSFP